LLTYHLLKNAGFHVALAGNVGFSMARQVAEQRHDWYVLEVSSFQLDGIDTFKPDIAVLLNITPDHLDRYKYALQNYVNSKFRIVRNMEPDQHFIYYADDPVIARELKTRPVVPHQVKVSLNRDADAPVKAEGSVMQFGLYDNFQVAQSQTTLKGPHNLINTMAAVSAAYLAGLESMPFAMGSKPLSMPRIDLKAWRRSMGWNS
jgi:UDP-N-acetylmuramoylalanine-D-glutamate ligase